MMENNKSLPFPVQVFADNLTVTFEEGILRIKQKRREDDLPELKNTFVIYFIDIDPDTGFISLMQPVSYTELEGYATQITKFLNLSDNDDGCRTYYYQQL